MNAPWRATFLAGVLLFAVANSCADKTAKTPTPQTTKHSASDSAGATDSQAARTSAADSAGATGSQAAKTSAADSAPPWQDPVIKAIAGGGLSLVSLSFAAFAFLYGALLGLRDENLLDARVLAYKRKLAGAVYGTAIAVSCAATLVVLSFISLVRSSRNTAIATVCLAVVILFGLSAIAWNLAFDLYWARRKLQSS